MRLIRVGKVGVACLSAFAAVVCQPAKAIPRGGPGLTIGSRPTIMAGFGGTPCTGLSYDTNTPFTSIALAGIPNPYVVIERFTPSSKAFSIQAICAATQRLGAPVSYEVVLYSDNGGQPGTRLLVAPGGITSMLPGVGPGAWQTSSVAGLAPPVVGPFWAGLRFPPLTPFGLPQEFGPSAQVRTSMTDGSSWDSVSYIVPIRVVGLDPYLLGMDVPALSGFCLAALVAALAVGGFLVIRKR